MKPSTDGASATATQEDAAGTQVEAPVNGNGRTLVWNHFEKVKVEEDVTKAICNYCQKSYHFDSKYVFGFG